MLDFLDPDQSNVEAVYRELLLLYSDSNNEEGQVCQVY
jgi:hypothetical protein